MNKSNMDELNSSYDKKVLEDNKGKINELKRILEYSKGQFSLVLVICNSTSYRQILVEQIRQDFSDFKSLKLDPEAISLFSQIKQDNKLESTSKTVMVFDVEMVKKKDLIFSVTNQIREEFLEFDSPVVLWVRDAEFRQLARNNTDTYTWAQAIIFETPTEYYLNFLNDCVKGVWNHIKESRENEFLNKDLLGFPENSFRCQEFIYTSSFLNKRKNSLDPKLSASLKFIRGLIEDNNTIKSRDLYIESLTEWNKLVSSTNIFIAQDSDNKFIQEVIGHVNFYLGLWWGSYAARNRRETEEALRQSQAYFESAVESYKDIDRLDLVGNIIDFLATSIHRINLLSESLGHSVDWSLLNETANEAILLHQSQGNLVRQARARGFLAEAAIAEKKFKIAEHLSTEALNLISSWSQSFSERPSDDDTAYYKWVFSFHQSWYLLSKGIAELKLKKIDTAIRSLRKATEISQPEYDPELYIQVLKHLRDAYWEKGEILKAFEARLDKEAVESSFNYRAFIGAGKLQPKHQVTNPVLPNVITQDVISTSGRRKDVDLLLKRLKSNQFKLTIIYGQSGVGKSSVIEAGLLPELAQLRVEDRRLFVVHLQQYNKWLNTLKKVLNNQPIKESYNDSDLYDFHQSNKKLRNDADYILKEIKTKSGIKSGQLVILILDQFEDFFLDCRQSEIRSIFYEFLGNCLEMSYVKVIISIREDYIHNLLDFNRYIDLNIIDNSILDKKWLYFIGNFSYEEARNVFVDLTQNTPFNPSDKLIDKVVQDLAGQFNEVRPIELQILGSQLQKEGITSIEEYYRKGNEEIQSKDKLIQSFLQDILNDCRDHKDLARLVLFLLVDNQDNRLIKSYPELGTGLKDLPHKPKFKKENLDLVIDILTKSGVVLKIHGFPSNYQIVHDYIASLVSGQKKIYFEEVECELAKIKRQRESDNKKLKRRFKYTLFAGFTSLFLLTVVAWLLFISENSKKELKAAKSKLLISTIKNHMSNADTHVAEKNKLAALHMTLQAGKLLQEDQNSSDIDIESDALESLNKELASKLQGLLVSIREKNRLEGHSDGVLSVAFNPDGTKFVSSSSDGQIKLWKSNGKLIETFSSQNSDIREVSYSQDGNFIASVNDSGNLIIWNQKGEILRKIQAHEGEATSVAFHPNGEALVSAGGDGQIKFWGLNGEMKYKINAHDSYISSLSFSPDGEIIASGSGDKTIKFWNVSKIEINNDPIQILEGHKEDVWDIQFSPNGKYLISAGFDHTVRLWKRDGSQIRVLEHTDRVLGVDFSPDGQKIASSSADKSILIWSLSGQVLETFEGHKIAARGVKFSPDNKTIASAGLDGTIRLWQYKDDFLTSIFLSGHDDESTNVSFNPVNQNIATSGIDKTIRIWDYQGKEIEKYGPFPERFINISFSPKGDMIVGVSLSSTLKLLNLNDGSLKNLDLPGNTISDVKFHPRENIFASAGKDGSIRFWNHEGKLMNEFKIHEETESSIYSIEFSPDGKRLAVSNSENSIDLWSIDGSLLETIESTQDVIERISFSNDGQHIASASNDSTINFWDNRGNLLNTFIGHESRVTSIVFSPDDKLFASGDIDGKIILWDRDGRQLKILHSLGKVWDLDFDSRGELLVSVGENGRIWPINTQEIQNSSPDNLESEDIDSLLSSGCEWIDEYIETSIQPQDNESQPCTY